MQLNFDMFCTSVMVAFTLVSGPNWLFVKEEEEKQEEEQAKIKESASNWQMFV